MVFILSPDEDNDGIYNVISIGYNYDGKHDFVTYQILDEDAPVGFDYVLEENDSGFTSGSNLMFHGEENILKKYMDEHFPRAPFDGYIPKDQIFEISRLMPAKELNSYAPRLFYEVYTH